MAEQRAEAETKQKEKRQQSCLSGNFSLIAEKCIFGHFDRSLAFPEIVYF
jgi:hypothetical protein